MYSVKKNVLETVAILKSHQVRQIVLSPGSRNAPLIQTFSADPYFDCHIIVDERNAAFYALGIIEAKQEPVAVCCTSGSALLNYASAVSEAFYQNLPLIVVSADRSPEWIGQMDGQTIPQVNAFGALVAQSVNLPEIKDETDLWFCNRLLNEALIACQRTSKPVHINVPLSEPLFDYSERELPLIRKIHFENVRRTADVSRYVEKWKQAKKRLIIVGQQFYSQEIISILEWMVDKTDCVVFSEHLSNCNSDSFIHNFDATLSAFADEQKHSFSPDLVISFGGHIISKRLKHFLRQNKPSQHWHVSNLGEIVDLFQSLTDVIESPPSEFLEELSEKIQAEETKLYGRAWKDISMKIPEPSDNRSFSDIGITGQFMKLLPQNALLHLANSSAVRNAQLFCLDNEPIQFFCNRGVNGIESALPTAIGFASVTKGNVYLAVGDLSFFYGVGSLWNIEHIKNLRILLFNNSSGGIFHLLPGLDKASSLKQYVAAEHHTTAEGWALAANLKYLSAKNNNELDEAFKEFFNDQINQSILLEVHTHMDINKNISQEYYNQLKNLI